VGVDEQVVYMEVDTGASTTIMSEVCYHKWWPGRSLQPSRVTSVLTLLSKYERIFQAGLETYKGFKVDFEVNQNTTPQFCKARPLPYSERKRVEEEMARLVEEGTIQLVEYADWTAQIAAVLKSDKTS